MTKEGQVVIHRHFLSHVCTDEHRVPRHQVKIESSLILLSSGDRASPRVLLSVSHLTAHSYFGLLSFKLEFGIMSLPGSVPVFLFWFLSFFTMNESLSWILPKQKKFGTSF
jgi:hypothetical protein